MSAAQVSGPRDPARSMLTGGVIYAVPALLLSVIVALVLAGPAGGGSAVIGGVLAALALAVAPLVMRFSRHRTPVAVMALAVTAYAGVVIVLGIAFVLLGSVEWLHGTAAGGGVFVTASAWLIGLYRTSARMRTLLFDDVPDGSGSAR